MIPRINYYRHRPITQDLNLDAYKAAVDDTAKAYDISVDKRDNLLKALSTIQSNSKGLQYVDGVAANIKASLDQLGSGIQGNNRWDLAEQGIRDLTNKFIGDKVIQAIKISHDNHVEGEKTKQELLKKGEAVNLAKSYDKYSPLNEDGSINIYSPEWQQKADYGAKAKELSKNLPTQIDSTLDKLQDINGYIKVTEKQHLIRGAKEAALPTALREYANSSEGEQQATLIRNELDGKPENEIQKAINNAHRQTVQDAFDLAEVEALKSKTSLHTDVIGQQEYQYNRIELAQNNALERQEQMQRDRLELAGVKQDYTKDNIAYRQQLKNQHDAEKSGVSNENNTKYLGISKGIANNAIPGYQALDGNNTVTRIRSDKELNAINNTLSPARNLNDYVIDASVKSKISGEKVVKGFKAFGFNSINLHDPSYDGGYFGEVTYTDEDGSHERTIPAIMRNPDNTIVSLYSGVSAAKKAQIALETVDMGKNNSAQANFIPIDRNVFTTSKYRPSTEVSVLPFRNKHGVKFVPHVNIYNPKTGKDEPMAIRAIPYAVKDRLGLLGINDQYTLEQLRNKADNKLADQVQDNIDPAKKQSELPSAQ